MKHNQYLMAVAVVLLCAGALMWRSSHSVAPLPSLGPDVQERFQGVGRILGEEAGKVLKPNTTVVICRQPVKVWIPENELAGFTKALQQARLKITEGPVLKFATEAGAPVYYLTQEQYAAIQQSTPGVVAIITFGGLPSPATVAVMQESSTHPRVIVINEEARRVRPLLASNVVTWAAVQRYEPIPNAASEPKTAREQFDRDYQLLGETAKP